ncbi:MAG: asparagine synthase (glutamine-hydrolyzing) [Vicinamibacterales bacterium]
MCGIAGGVFWAKRSRHAAVSTVQRMTDALSHRGPDGAGVVECHQTSADDAAPVVVMGHRRLAIIDLTDRAAQPMVSDRLPLWITFNGEIYNFKTIRRELERLGRRFRSDSDTEVILQGYEQWGEAVVDRLQGMFAFAIWDGRSHRLFAARDRFGIKPLYLYRTHGGVLFASEIRALLASGLVPKALDHAALAQYLAHQTVPPPRTLVEGVRVLPPGCTESFDSVGTSVQRPYWDLLDAADRSASAVTEEDARDRVRQLLEESTRLHLISDVPVGVFLSGGIDSTAVAALVRTAGVTPRTFCVSFPGTRYDEGPYARAVADAIGADHTDLPLSETEFRRQLPEALASVDHPSGDGVNTFVVSRAVRHAGIKVALSGLGGDELFGGYPSFTRLRRIAGYARLWKWTPEPVRRAAAATVRGVGGSSVLSSRVAALLETDASLPHAYPLTRQLFSTARRLALLDVERRPTVHDAETDPYVALLERAVARHPQASSMSLVSYAEARTYMHDVLLRDTDQMSMAHGLEVRVPLLDHQLAEYVMGLSGRTKEPNGVPKRLLLEALGGNLPASVRRPKRGFVLPLDPWMRTELRSFCEHHLGPEGMAGHAILNPDAVQSVWQSFMANDGTVSWSRPWALVALNAWLESTGVAA